jgi:hypothetical protein
MRKPAAAPPTPLSRTERELFSGVRDGTKRDMDERYLMGFYYSLCLVFAALSVLAYFFTHVESHPIIFLTLSRSASGWTERPLLTVDVHIVIIVVLALNALANLLYVSCLQPSVTKMLRHHHFNFYRWLQYTTTWSGVTYCSSMVCGIRNIIDIVVLMVMTVSCLWCAFLVEYTRLGMAMLPVLLSFLTATGALFWNLAMTSQTMAVPLTAWIYLPVITAAQFGTWLILWRTIAKLQPHSLTVEVLHGLLSLVIGVILLCLPQPV